MTQGPEQTGPRSSIKAHFPTGSTSQLERELSHRIFLSKSQLNTHSHTLVQESAFLVGSTKPKAPREAIYSLAIHQCEQSRLGSKKKTWW